MENGKQITLSRNKNCEKRKINICEGNNVNFNMTRVKKSDYLVLVIKKIDLQKLYRQLCKGNYTVNFTYWNTENLQLRTFCELGEYFQTGDPDNPIRTDH